MPQLTPNHVTLLLSDPSEEHRAETAAKIADDFQDGLFSQQEIDLAISIFRIMAADAAVRVRLALAEHLNESPHLPRDIALTLAHDVDQVAAPMLRYCDVLTEEDLIEIVKSSGEVKHMAIAARAILSGALSDSLVLHGSEKVVTEVLANPGARIGEETFGTALDRFPASDRVSTAITRRGLIPVAIAERLIVRATEVFHEQLSRRAELDTDAMADLVMRVRERATLSLVDPRFGIGDARQLVTTLDQHGRLTPSIILRALCMGDIAFFEAAMAHFTRLPDLNVMVLVHDEGRRGLQGLWRKAGMPALLLPAVIAAVEVADELGYDGEPGDRERYRRRVIERLLTQCDGDRIDPACLGEGGVEYLLGKLEELSAA